MIIIDVYSLTYRIAITKHDHDTSINPFSQRSAGGLCCWSTSLSARPRRTSVGRRPTGRHGPGRFKGQLKAMKGKES